MSSPTRQSSENGSRRFRWVTATVGSGVVLAEIAGAYIALRSMSISDIVAFGGTATIAVVIGGSFLYVASRQMLRVDSVSDSSDKPILIRVPEVIVSATVLTAVTILLGSIGGLGLTVLATLGGPDPKTNDGELLRHRLLGWVQRNRNFMRNNGRGKLPLTP